MTAATQLCLLPSVPAFLDRPVTRIEHAFARFHRENPHVYEELERLALDLWQRRRPPRIGIAMLYETCRYNRWLVTAGDAFKLNNNFRSLYGRLLIHRHPELSEVIELRERREMLATLLVDQGTNRTLGHV